MPYHCVGLGRNLLPARESGVSRLERRWRPRSPSGNNSRVAEFILIGARDFVFFNESHALALQLRPRVRITTSPVSSRITLYSLMQVQRGNARKRRNDHNDHNGDDQIVVRKHLVSPSWLRIPQHVFSPTMRF